MPKKMTQDGRLMTISTPLAKDFLMIKRMSATEGLSQLFKIHVELIHEEEKEGYAPTAVNIKDLLGQPVTITVSQRDGGERSFSGIVNEFSQGNRNPRFSFYYATIVPQIWILTQNIQSRIFQHKSVPDILKEVFAGFEVSYEMSGTFDKRNYCVQYRESDFDFASRLMEEEGIYYYFKHADGKHKLIIGNTTQSHSPCPKKDVFPFLKIDGTDRWITAIKSWRTDYRLQTGKITNWDHNFQLPTNRLEVQQPSFFDVGGNQKLEFYDYPGGYARKYDGIDKSGGEQASDLQKIFQDNTKTAKMRMEALDAQYKTANGVSDCCTMTAGHRFEMNTHPNKDFNGAYVLTSVSHEAEQSPDYISNDEVSRAYENSFSCIAHGNPAFRPLEQTPKPVIQGSQTAVVVGPSGEEIFTDKYGRVKVQFYWDRYGQVNSDSSCWVRVAQSWAGNNWGTMFIPRIGMEVVVHFLEGDPDQPIITGCVYNPDTMPPYTLPDEKTKSTLKSNSSKGGGGFNEFRFEDKKGSEQIFMHGEKDLDIRIKNDAKELIKRDRHLIIERDQFEQVKKDKHMKVKGDHNEQVDGQFSLKVGTSKDVKTGTKFAVDAGTEVHLKAGTTVTVEASASLTLKVGGSFVNISPAGVSIQGTMVNINSAGAAGSGSGASPNPPKDPLEADNAQPGKTPKPMPAPKPLSPTQYSQLSQAIKNAAKKGAPFVAKSGGGGGGGAKSSKSPAKSSGGGASPAKSSAPAQSTAAAKEAVAKQEQAIKQKQQELQKVVKEKADLLSNTANEVKAKAENALGGINKAVADVKAKEEAIKKEISQHVDKIKETVAEQEKALEQKKEELKNILETKENMIQPPVKLEGAVVPDEIKADMKKGEEAIKAKEQEVSKEIAEKKQFVEDQKKKL